MPGATSIYTLLDSIGVRYERYDHEAVLTCHEAERAVPAGIAVHTKNLFLRDKRGRRHLLLVTTCAKAVDIKRFAGQADADTLSFASAERLQRHLGVSQGAVSLLALLNDAGHDVELYLDADVWAAATIFCHPLVNTATLVLSHADVERVLAHTGHRPRVLPIG